MAQERPDVLQRKLSVRVIELYNALEASRKRLNLLGKAFSINIKIKCREAGSYGRDVDVDYGYWSVAYDLRLPVGILDVIKRHVKNEQNAIIRELNQLNIPIPPED